MKPITRGFGGLTTEAEATLENSRDLEPLPIACGRREGRGSYVLTTRIFLAIC